MYLYRYDGIAELRAQRLGLAKDPVLRGARRSGYENYYPHYQIKDAHAACPKEHAVYRLSFWRSFERGLHYASASPSPSILQRVRADHSALAHFEFGDDEYLVGQAYLYWSTQPINSDNPDWSAIGIPHADLEVLLPTGEWVPMNEVPAINEDPTHRIMMGDSVFRVNHIKFEENKKITLIRQYSGEGFSVYCAFNLLEPLLYTLLTNGQCDPASKYIYTLETSDRIVAKEISPAVVYRRRRGLMGLIDRLRGTPPFLAVHIARDGKTIEENKIRELYNAANLGWKYDLLKKWNYKALDGVVHE